MNEELERLLPKLSVFKYSMKHPARFDLQVTLVQCVIDRLLEMEGEVPLRRVMEVLNDYFQRKNSGIWRQLKMSPEKVRTIVFGLAKPFDKRVSKVGIINPTFQSTCINKLIEKFVMTNECTVARNKREEVRRQFDTTIDFSYIRRGFLLNVEPVYFERIRTWWWDESTKKGFVKTRKGKEIVSRAGCLVRFLIYSQKDSLLKRYRFQLYSEIAAKIGEAIEKSRRGFIDVTSVCYAVFGFTPFFVDEGIVANVVLATRELEFLDRWTIRFSKIEDSKEKKKKKREARRAETRESSLEKRNYSSDEDYFTEEVD